MSKKKKNKEKKKSRDSELSVEQVTEAELFPKKKHGSDKPLSRHTRPVNGHYRMIDPDSDTCDASKS